MAEEETTSNDDEVFIDGSMWRPSGDGDDGEGDGDDDLHNHRQDSNSAAGMGNGSHDERSTPHSYVNVTLALSSSLFQNSFLTAPLVCHWCVNHLSVTGA